MIWATMKLDVWFVGPDLGNLASNFNLPLGPLMTVAVNSPEGLQGAADTIEIYIANHGDVWTAMEYGFGYEFVSIAKDLMQRAMDFTPRLD